MATSFSISPSTPATLLYFLLPRFPFLAPVYARGHVGVVVMTLTWVINPIVPPIVMIRAMAQVGSRLLVK